MSSNKPPSKIILTGSLGFLGQHLLVSLAAAYPDKSVIALARTPRSLHAVSRLPANVTLRTGIDLRSLNFHTRFFGPGDIVIHNAALVSYLRRDAARMHETNVTGTRNLLRICLRKQVRRFILISSVSAVGRHPRLPADESVYPLLHRLRPDPYAHTKLLSEIELESHSGRIEHLILNPGVIIGPGAAYLSSLIRLASHSPLLPTVNSLNSFVDARDVAAATVLAAASDITDRRFIVTSHQLTNTEFLHVLLGLLDKKPMLFHLPPGLIRSLDHPVRVLDLLRLYPFTKIPSSLLIPKTYTTAKIRSDLGWQPRYSLEQSLTDTIRWVRYGPQA